MEKKKQRPIKQVRIGRVKAAIWERETENGSLYSVSFQRLYRTDDEKWGQSEYFNRDDLLTLLKVADLAHSAIVFELQPGDKTEEAG